MDIANFSHTDKHLEQYLNILVRKISQAIRTATGAGGLYNGGPFGLMYGQAVQITTAGMVANTDSKQGAIGVCDRKGGCDVGALCPVSSNGEHLVWCQSGLSPVNGNPVWLDSGNPAFDVSPFGSGGKRFVGFVKDASMYSTFSPPNLYVLAVINMPVEPIPAV